MTAPEPPPRLRASGNLTGRQLEAEVSREVARIRAEHEPVMPSTRCRVCQHPESRSRVNTLLGYGMGDTEILNFIEDINDKRSKNNKITTGVIRNHRFKHFNVQAPTQAGFRRIMERRRAQLTDEFGEAASNLLTGKAYLEVMAEKGWQHLVNDDTEVHFEIGLKARLQLEAMEQEGAFEEQVAQMKRDVALLQQAVRDVAEGLPDAEGEKLLRDITERIDELTGKGIKKSTEDDDEILDAEVVEDVDDFYDQDDDGGYDPVIGSDDGDSIEE